MVGGAKTLCLEWWRGSPSPSGPPVYIYDMAPVGSVVQDIHRPIVPQGHTENMGWDVFGIFPGLRN
jgi:hypothetical protein